MELRGIVFRRDLAAGLMLVSKVSRWPSEDMELMYTYALVCERLGVTSARMETLLRVVVGVDLVESAHDERFFNLVFVKGVIE